MRKTLVASVLFVAAVGGGACLETRADESTVEYLQQLSGAIFTTTADGTVVNENTHYEAKTDVYLDGGPGPGAPNSAACLPAGYYYFQVTDPPGKVLLSEDEIGCRRFEITAACTMLYAPENCAVPHVTGTDLNDGGQTIQLMPYANTPNNGDEYKVWATPVDDYDEDQAEANEPNFGFINAFSKTDNFKVEEEENPPKPPCCGDYVIDPGETCDDGNTMDGDGCSSTCQLEHPYCGNSIVEGDEQCDDGNDVETDGCSSECVCLPTGDQSSGRSAGKAMKAK
jgi:cysteine-rich repeat protein